MARKNSNSKAKERKQRRAEEAEQTNLHWQKVEQANTQNNPLEALVSFQSFTKNGLTVKLECVRRAKLDPDLFRWIFQLTKTNMQEAYEESWGWNDKDKLKELDDDRMWFLVARNDQDGGNPIAFSSFRFDLDFGKPVVYCYEIHLQADMQRKGLGRFMMQVLQLFAIKNHMHKVVATVLHCNPASKAFFMEKLKYTVDETSPPDEHYIIVSKPVPERNIS